MAPRGKPLCSRRPYDNNMTIMLPIVRPESSSASEKKKNNIIPISVQPLFPGTHFGA